MTSRVTLTNASPGDEIDWATLTLDTSDLSPLTALTYDPETHIVTEEQPLLGGALGRTATYTVWNTSHTVSATAVITPLIVKAEC